ncbi:MAG: error-prone DNA polymerase [Acidobacteria bacterium]|nr:MAG: error-prone DNA polymerase [Acidobacteriota bacterium]
MSSSYIELHTASAFSFLQGASLPEALVDRAAELGYPAIALLDRDGVYGAPRFHKAATAAGIRPIIGAELTIAGTGEAGRAGEPIPPVQPFMLPVLCESAEGYQNLSKLITRMKMRAHAPASPPRAPARWGGKGEGALTLDDLDGHTRGLVALAGRAALDVRRHGVGGLLDRLVGVFGRANVYVELQRHLRRDEERDTEALVSLASAFGVPTIATNGVRFATRVERPLFDVLTCIHHHTTVAEAGRQLTPNAERYLKPPGEMAELFRDRRDAVARTRELADRLQYTMADLGYRFPDYPVPPGETQASFLRKITDVGARERYRPYHDRARAQIARELDLIEKLELAGYFLIVWDVVNFCRRHDILVQGRGSAANSAVCYSLGITAVDPVGMDLLFERFLSEERGEWPDIDLDLPSGDRREQVIQHVYEKYGRLGAAMTANVITYRGRSAAREVGKVLGFDAAQVDRLAKIMNQFEFADPADTLPRQLAAVGLDLNSDRVRTFARIWNQMLDLPRHLGQHSGGMVICQGQLDAVVPLENASMPGRVVVQWDKDDCADMGIVKVDLLGLGMMAVIQDSLALVNGPGFGIRDSGFESHGLESCRLESRIPNPESRVDLAHLPEDPAVYKMLCDADTVGVFQVESRAQMATLPRLKPARFYDIVVQVAIIRPGPIVGQMVHPYLNRRAGREPVKYPHPSLEPILARTLGVPLFQEQLLRMAMIAAGFTGGQAEELRRAFGFKRSERRMKQVEVQLREGMARQGITGDAAEEIIRSITSFALYGFPESHAASFALLAYASAYLKVHYPAAFYTALLNNQPMGFYHPATLVKDAQRRGVRFHPIDVQLSDWDCRVEPDGAIRLGLRYVSGLRQEVGKAIAWASARLNSQLRIPSPRPPAPSSQICPKCGCDDASMLEQVDAHRWFCNTCSHEWRAGSVSQRFRSLDDLIARTALRRDEVVTLADIGALNSFGYDRRSALWQAERAVRPSGEMFDEAATGWAAGEAGWAGAEDTEHDLRRSVLDTPERSARGSSECECASEVSGGGAPQALRNAARASARGHEDELRRSVLDMPERSARGSSECECASEVSGGGAPRALRNAARASARGGGAPRELKNDDTDTCPLKPMTESERLVADFAGMGLSIGRHPMALRREELSMRGILRAIDLRHERQGRRVRVAGMVITRQRPGTAKGFVFLTLEDETGIANIIVRPDLFARDRLTIVEEPFLIVDGVLQNQDGVTSVRAEEVRGMRGVDVDFDAHDFY